MSQGNGNRGPWGNGPQRGRPEHRQPELDDIIRKGQDRFKDFMGGRGDGGEKKIIIMGLVGLLFLWLGSGIFKVDSAEVGVVLRFGEFHHIAGPGLNYHLPYPIETVLTPNVTAVNKVEVGYRSGGRNSQRAVAEESLMLTADRNIVDINFDVLWKIDASKPQDFLFNVRFPELMVKPVAESAMREVIGRNNLTDILTTAQSQIADDTTEIMQAILDEYESGIYVDAVNLSKPDVPSPVIDEFQDVKRAEQEKETAESVAEGYRNEIIPRAKGQAVEMVQQAEAYKNRVIAEAEGDAARFNAVYDEYRQAKDVTRKRMYLETMEEILPDMPKMILDTRGSQGALPYLPLDQLNKRRSQ